MSRRGIGPAVHLVSVEIVVQLSSQVSFCGSVVVHSSRGRKRTSVTLPPVITSGQHVVVYLEKSASFARCGTPRHSMFGSGIPAEQWPRAQEALSTVTLQEWMACTNQKRQS